MFGQDCAVHFESGAARKCSLQGSLQGAFTTYQVCILWNAGAEVRRCEGAKVRRCEGAKLSAKGAKLSAKGARLGVGGVSSPNRGVWRASHRETGGPPQGNFSSENAQRVGLRLSGVQIYIYETTGFHPYYTTTKDQLTFNEGVLKTSCKCRSVLIPKLRSKKIN